MHIDLSLSVGLYVGCCKLNCFASRARPHLSRCESCCRWPETSPLAVAIWRRTTSYTGSGPQPIDIPTGKHCLGKPSAVMKLHYVTDSVFFQRYCCKKLLTYLPWTRQSSQNWRLWHGTRHIQVCTGSALSHTDCLHVKAKRMIYNVS